MKEERENNENGIRETQNKLKERKSQLKEIGHKIRDLTELLKPVSTDIPDIPVDQETLVEVILQCGDKLEKAFNVYK